MEITLELKNLTKIYTARKSEKKALDGVSFTLGPGLYGLLGPNGAGKRTRRNITTGNPDAGGSALWNGSYFCKNCSAFAGSVV